MSDNFYVNCDALEAASARLSGDRERILTALGELEGARKSLSVTDYFKLRSLASSALKAADALERQRLFLSESAKRFRGAQTRAVKRGEQL